MICRTVTLPASDTAPARTLRISNRLEAALLTGTVLAVAGFAALFQLVDQHYPLSYFWTGLAGMAGVMVGSCTAFVSIGYICSDRNDNNLRVIEQHDLPPRLRWSGTLIAVD